MSQSIHLQVVAVAVAGCLTLAAGVPAGGALTRLDLAAAESHVLIGVGKAGLFGFAGHAHEVVAPEVSGNVTLDEADWSHSSVSLEFKSAALRVSGKGEPPADVPQVQQVMLGPRVLDAAHFPTVSFRSTRIAAGTISARGADLRIDGDLTLHGVTRPVTVPARVTLDGDGSLTARGTFTVKQTAFGIEPVTAGGGTVRVRDEVDVTFVLKARR
jgi:polyisoprenoid-binding protein YceI